MDLKQGSDSNRARLNTRFLFTPAPSKLRMHSGFQDLTARMGLTDYWRRSSLKPDFA